MQAEIEVEGVGIMRPLNDWQIHRARRIADRRNRAIAFVAFGLGMSVPQFKKLPAEQQREAWQAHNSLTAPHTMAAVVSATLQPAKPPSRYTRLSEAEMADLGRKLLKVKAELPRGHFLPWIEEKSGITYSQAQRWMKAARMIEADSLSRSTANV